MAGALIARPRVLFLDEPTTGLDPPQPGRHVGVHRLAGGRGHHDPADHAVPGGGGPPRRQHRRHRPRQGDRARHRRRAQGSGRRAPAGVHRRRRGGSWHRRSGCASLAIADPRSTSRAGASPCRCPAGRTCCGRRCACSTTRVTLVDVGLRRPDLDDVFLTLTGHRRGSARSWPRRNGGDRAMSTMTTFSDV